MKAKHHLRKGRTLQDPAKPPGPQNPWIDKPIQRKSPMEGTIYQIGPKLDKLKWAVSSAIARINRQ